MLTIATSTYKSNLLLSEKQFVFSIKLRHSTVLDCLKLYDYQYYISLIYRTHLSIYIDLSKDFESVNQSIRF